jgi:excisionase family DNA binding protein
MLAGVEAVPMVMTEEELLTVEEVAARLKVHRETVRAWLRHGRLRGTRPGGTRLGWRIPASELERLLREGYPDTPPPAPAPTRLKPGRRQRRRPGRRP